jgi:rhodanese-related sulfurtransferase
MNQRSPLARAVREARGIILGALLVAVGYNLFAGTGVPWIRQVKHGDTASFDQIFGETGAVAPKDTAAVAVVPSVDTTAAPTDTAAQTAALKEADARRIADSLKQVRLDSAKKAQETQTKPSTPPPTPKVTEITTATAKQIFDAKKALFIDARPAEQFGKGHIPGAINIYASEFQDHINELLVIRQKNPDTVLVAYCGGGLCELSHELADQLKVLGFRVLLYTGGTEEWQASKYPFTGEEK